jgi:hypothetical protein
MQKKIFTSPFLSSALFLFLSDPILLLHTDATTKADENQSIQDDKHKFNLNVDILVGYNCDKHQNHFPRALFFGHLTIFVICLQQFNKATTAYELQQIETTIMFSKALVTTF